MATTLYLIRHGETDWNAQGRWQGHTNIPLNSIGQRQSELVAQRLCDEGVSFDAIYSSDLTRAYQTAWEIGAAVRVAVQLLPPLRELDVGQWSGLTRAEIKTRYPVEFQLMEAGADLPRGGGETAAAFLQRVVEITEAMVSQHPNSRLAFVTHGGAIWNITNYVLSKNETSPVPRGGHIGNASITIVRFDGEQRELISFNDVTHLANLNTAGNLVTAHPDDSELAGLR
ncbi:MAG: histidine phosphatase family protein [Chloroflexaceae bacterium]|nr:histidine phosphatase family protein [Chloroflexaceae bacterium]